MIRLLFLLFFFLSLSVSAQYFTPQVDSIPMRDGKKLAADIYKPVGSQSLPTILIQTPYNRLYYRWGLPLGIDTALNSCGYNFVIVDWRGFYGSASAITANPARGEDGYDVVEWIAQQSWSDGYIGTWGPSALGKIQFQTAKENPPHLACCVPLVAGSQFSYAEYYPGGVYRTEYLQQLDALGYGLSPFVLANPFYSFSWQYVENLNYYPSQIQVPCFMIGGWFDHNIDLMIDLFDGLKQLSPTSVRDQHKLMIGPWAHGGFGQAQVGTCTQGELTFNEACGWSDSLALAFLDYYLRQADNDWLLQPVVRFFQMGENNWYGVNSWPTSSSLFSYYLDNTNKLSTVLPLASGVSSYQYDPADPSPTYGGPTLRQDLLQGPYDQSTVVESRNDLAIFTSEVLLNDLVLQGVPVVKFFVSSDRFDTDFAIRFCDVYPDGRSILLSDGIQRMRFRNGYTTADTSSLVPGNVYFIEIELPDIAHTFLAGHRIRLDISSANYPRFDNNLNNGSDMYVSGDTLIASNSIYYGDTYPSRIELPVVGTAGSDFIQRDNISVWPNPTSGYVYFHDEVEFESIQVYNSIGKMILKEEYNNQQIDLTFLDNGVYYLSGKLKNGSVFSTKVVIIH